MTHHTPTDPAVTRPFAELRDSGLLWLINRTAFHPHGYALAIHHDENSEPSGWSLYPTDDHTPWMFRPEDDGVGFRRAQATLAAALPRTTPASDARCAVCNTTPVVYRNYLEQPFCAGCVDCACGQDVCIRTTPAPPAPPASRVCLHCGQAPGVVFDHDDFLTCWVCIGRPPEDSDHISVLLDCCPSVFDAQADGAVLCGRRAGHVAAHRGGANGRLYTWPGDTLARTSGEVLREASAPIRMPVLGTSTGDALHAGTSTDAIRMRHPETASAGHPETASAGHPETASTDPETASAEQHAVLRRHADRLARTLTFVLNTFTTNQPPDAREHQAATSTVYSSTLSRWRRDLTTPPVLATDDRTVQGRCPACGRESLFLGTGGYVTCGSLECPNPAAPSERLDDPPHPANPCARPLCATARDELADTTTTLNLLRLDVRVAAAYIDAQYKSTWFISGAHRRRRVLNDLSIWIKDPGPDHRPSTLARR